MELGRLSCGRVPHCRHHMSDEYARSADTNLGQRTAVAFGWGIFANVLKMALTLIVQGAMARFLGPSAFGLFAMGMLVMGLASYFSDMGISTRLIQQQTINDADVAFALTMNLIMSTVVSIVVILCADLLADFFGAHEAKPIFIAMAPVFVLNAIASVSASLLRRRLDYRTIQLAGLGGYVVGFAIVGTLCAAFLDSVYALVAAYIVQSIVYLLLMYLKVRHSFQLNFSFSQRRDHLTFGGTVLMTNLVNWSASSIDKVMIGRAFSAGNLGYYTAAYNLIFAPVGMLYQNLQSTVFSSMARMDGDKIRMRQAYLELLKAITLLVFPIFIGALILANTLIAVVYGPKWVSSGEFAQIFCIIAPLQLVWGISTPVLWNTNRKSTEALIQIPFVLISAIAMIVAAKYSTIAVAQVAALTFALRTFTMVGLACQILQISTKQVVISITPSLALAIFVGAAVWSVDQLLASAESIPLLRLMIGGAMVGVAILLAILIVPSLLPSTLKKLMHRYAHRAPSWSQPVIFRMTGKIE